MALKLNDEYKEKASKIPLKMDIYMLNSIIGFIFKDSVQVTRRALINIRKLFSIIDEDIYKINAPLYARFNFINKALEAKIDCGFENIESVINFCVPDVSDKETDTIIKELDNYRKINYEEMKYLMRAIDDRLEFAHIYKYKDRLYEPFERLESGDYKTFREINDQFLSICTDMVHQSRKIKSYESSNRLNFADENAKSTVVDIVSKLKNPSRQLITGIRKFNEILSPAFMSGRLYTILGLPGGWKSGMLLHIAKDIKTYNPWIKPNKPGKIPTVYIVTMENDVDETVERLFNMVGRPEDIRGFSPKEVISILEKEGKFNFNKEGINVIIQYYPNRAIDTQRLYSDIDDLNDEGYEVIALILDYIKRIRPYERGKDTKEELKNVSNELKSLAQHYDIPVITAHQLNRSGQAAIDAAMTANKEDLGRLLGRSNVSEAWEVIENSDFVLIINVERRKDTGMYYLTFKRVKLRYKETSDLTYFNHPFAEGNKMRLIIDIDKEESVSLDSLAVEFEGVSMANKKGKKNATKREIVEDIFDFDNSEFALT